MDLAKSKGRLSESLQASELFRGVDPQTLGIILSHSVRQSYLRHEIITLQGERTETVRVLCSGTARFTYSIKSGEQIAWGWLKPGEALGAMVFTGRPQCARVTVQAVEDCETLEWNASTINSLADRFPILVRNALTVLLNHWDRCFATLELMIVDPAPVRVADVLDRAASQIGQKSASGTQLLISDEEIAQIAGTTIFTVSRLLQRWSRMGILIKSRGKIVISPGVEIRTHLACPSSSAEPDDFTSAEL